MANSPTSSPDESIRKLVGLIKGIRVAMLTTLDDDGTLRSRPMATQEDFDLSDGLYFFTREHSPKVDEVQSDRRVNLSYADPAKQHYVSISGRVRLVRDHKKAEELWSPALKAWFPGGLDDPELALLRVEPEKAEYWDSPSSTIVHVLGFLNAVVTGEPYHPGGNEKVDL